MNSIFNKLIIAMALIVLAIVELSLHKAILIILIAISISSFLEYFGNEILNNVVFIFYLVVCIIIPEFTFLLPLIMYDLFFTKYKYCAPLSIIPLLINNNDFQGRTVMLLVAICAADIILKNQDVTYKELYKKYIKQHDDLTETSIMLENKIIELTGKQDVEVNLATMNERNRIAREIHDNVGHLLSSSIIQIGAIMAITNDENTKENLRTVKNTLDSGMNSIRESVHNLHDESINLYSQLLKLKDNFNFCDIKFHYEVEANFQTKTKYTIIAIVKEALANVIKHSNATMLNITLNEHPKLIQLIIYDNGTNIRNNINNGMGLENIKQRVNAINGIVNFNTENGFRIFISFPKK